MQTHTDVLVIGGGIAGFGAALAAARQGYKTDVLTGATLGGQLIGIEQVEGYPGFEEGIAGYDLCPIVQSQAMAAGAGIAIAEATSIVASDTAGGGWLVGSPAGDYVARSVIAATGTRLRALGVPGESELAGKGVSHCASCDAPLLAGKPVVVAGGGDSAAQEALFLASHAASVTIVHAGRALTCQRSFAERIQRNSKIECIAEATITAVLGDAVVTGARIAANGNAESELEAAGVFVYVGLEPCAELFATCATLSDSGHLVTNAQLATSAPGLYAAGTVRDGAAGRAACAAGEGTAAALAACRFLGE